MKIKEPAVANMFYPGNADELRYQLEKFAENNANKYEYKTRAVIVPHAGYMYSGQLAYEGIRQLDKSIKNIFIFAPAHRVPFEGLALTGFDEWETPLGKISVNQNINNILTEKFGAKVFDEGHREEHAIEVQIPIIQTLFEDVKIIPVLVGRCNYEKITEIISEFYPEKENGFVISSDLSHFHTDEKAKKTDGETAYMIESGNIEEFSYDRACGSTGICGLTSFSNANGFSLIRINLMNSSVVSGDTSRVVGYGAWFLYEGTKNKFIKEFYSDYLLNLCREIIESKYNNKQVITAHPPVLNENGACFVTLKKNGNLRGCIGSIIAHQPLIDDIVQNSQSSAFRDFRFDPVEETEIKDLTIDISLLSEPKRMSFTDEADLLNQIVPKKDGIIIRDMGYQAVYLPSVWEDLPDKEIFLKSLKMKAGMPPEHFSATFEAYRFETEYIEQ